MQPVRCTLSLNGDVASVYNIAHNKKQPPIGEDIRRESHGVRDGTRKQEGNEKKHMPNLQSTKRVVPIVQISKKRHGTLC